MKPATPRKGRDIRVMLLDDDAPIEFRRNLLRQLCADDSEASTEVVKSILGAAAAQSTELIEARKNEELGQLIQEMREGPQRLATFIRLVGEREGPPRAHVVTEDGTSAYIAVPEPRVGESLRLGDTVLVEAQGRALLGKLPGGPAAGEEGRLERIIDAGRIEVSLSDQGRHVFYCAAGLQEMIGRGEVKPGAELLVCPRRRMAFDALPTLEGCAHYRFLSRESVPDVVVERDLGSPPAYIDKLARLVRHEMLHPERRRRYRLRAVVMKLLSGVSGSGKTYSILAAWRRIYELMSEVTGVPVADLPPRVLRLSAASVLSKWLGESDKHLNRFFNEAEALAAEPFTGPDGRTWRLPVLAVLEEIDGLARARGEDPIYDRILTTALQRLDPTRPELKDKLIIFLATTNVPQQVDPAFLRRIGGTVEHFGRLDRYAFASILGKHLRGVPLASANGDGPERPARILIHEMTDWLFSPNGSDSGQVEVHLVGASTPLIKHRRDFLTASIVDLAVQEAAEGAWTEEMQGCRLPGLTREMLQAAFERQIGSVVDRMLPGNAAYCTDLPEGTRVASIRRREQPALSGHSLERPPRT